MNEFTFTHSVFSNDVLIFFLNLLEIYVSSLDQFYIHFHTYDVVIIFTYYSVFNDIVYKVLVLNRFALRIHIVYE